MLIIFQIESLLFGLFVIESFAKHAVADLAEAYLDDKQIEEVMLKFYGSKMPL